MTDTRYTFPAALEHPSQSIQRDQPHHWTLDAICADCGKQSTIRSNPSGTTRPDIYVRLLREIVNGMYVCCVEPPRHPAHRLSIRLIPADERP